MLWKKQRCSHFSSGKKQSPWKVGTLIFFTAFLPMSGTLFFFRTEIFGLFSPSLPLVRWSQSFGYGVLASYDIKICTRPNIFLSKVPKKKLLKSSRILERFKSGDSSDSIIFNLVLHLEHFVLAGDRLHKSQPVFRYCKSLSNLSSLCLDGRALNGIFPGL